MEIRKRLQSHLNGPVRLKDRSFILESVEEDHIILRDEDAMHTLIELDSIQDLLASPHDHPEIRLKKRSL
jgi:hypothetical protein